MGWLRGFGVEYCDSWQAVMLAARLILRWKDPVVGQAKQSIGFRYHFGDVAQLARAPALQAGGRGFESHRLHKEIVS